jgi:hypothetical protein
MRPESQAQASDRGSGQPHGRVQAVRRLPHAADRRMIGVREPANGESRLTSLPGYPPATACARCRSGLLFGPEDCNFQFGKGPGRVRLEEATPCSERCLYRFSLLAHAA